MTRLPQRLTPIPRFSGQTASVCAQLLWFEWRPYSIYYSNYHIAQEKLLSQDF